MITPQEQREVTPSVNVNEKLEEARRRFLNDIKLDKIESLLPVFQDDEEIYLLIGKIRNILASRVIHQKNTHKEQDSEEHNQDAEGFRPFDFTQSLHHALSKVKKLKGILNSKKRR